MNKIFRIRLKTRIMGLFIVLAVVFFFYRIFRINDFTDTTGVTWYLYLVALGIFSAILGALWYYLGIWFHKLEINGDEFTISNGFLLPWKKKSYNLKDFKMYSKTTAPVVPGNAWSLFFESRDTYYLKNEKESVEITADFKNFKKIKDWFSDKLPYDEDVLEKKIVEKEQKTGREIKRTHAWPYVLAFLVVVSVISLGGYEQSVANGMIWFFVKKLFLPLLIVFSVLFYFLAKKYSLWNGRPLTEGLVENPKGVTFVVVILLCASLFSLFGAVAFSGIGARLFFDY